MSVNFKKCHLAQKDYKYWGKLEDERGILFTFFKKKVLEAHELNNLDLYFKALIGIINSSNNPWRHHNIRTFQFHNTRMSFREFSYLNGEMTSTA